MTCFFKRQVIFIINISITMKTVIAISLSFLLFSGCQVKYEGYKKSSSGLYYRFYIQQNEGKSPAPGDILSLNYQYGLQDTVLFDANEFGGEAMIPVPFDTTNYPDDLYEALSMMKIGDSASFVIKPESFFKKSLKKDTVPDFVKGKDLLFHIKLLKSTPMEELRAEYEKEIALRKENEQPEIQKYLDKYNLNIKPGQSGLYFIPLTPGSGPNVKTGDMVTVHFIISHLDGQEIFSTYKEKQPAEFELGKPFDTEGMNEGLLKMNKGSRAKLIIPSKLAFGEKGRGVFIQPYTPLICDIELVDFISKADFERLAREKAEREKALTNQYFKAEMEKLNEYIKQKNIRIAPLASGLYFLETKKGTGKQPTPGSIVQVHYTGKLLDGLIFDSSYDRNKPFDFTLGKGRVIKGWDEGVAQMREGSEATLIIPSNLAYGERGSGEKIPPYSTLIFEIKVISVK